MKYKVILFDADGTLFDFDRAEKFALSESFRHFGASYNEPLHLKIYNDINTQVWSELEEHKISADELKTERFRRYFNEVDLTLDAQAFSDFYLNALSQGSFLLNGAEDLVVQLAKHYKLVLLTNGLTSVQHPRFRVSPVYKYFSAIVVSEDIGVAKPQPGIFEYALKQIDHTEKISTLIVGDNLKSDIQGGINFGIDTCWFNPDSKENKTGIKPTYAIDRLDKLNAIL